MGSLVADFIINPVLRQARRFSRSSQAGTTINPNTNQSTPLGSDYEVAIEDISGRLGDLTGPEVGEDGSVQTISGAILTSSPIEDDGGLEAELNLMENNRPLSAPVALDSGSVPRRMLSLTSQSNQPDDDVSDNASFGIPSQFRSGSTSSNILEYNPNGHHVVLSPAEGQSRQSTQESRQGGAGSRQRNTSLPADDGMGYLRQQILAVQSTDIPPREKARLMHGLLTRGYSQTQESVMAKQVTKPQSSETLISQERPTTPGSLTSFIWQMNGSPETASHSQQHTFHLSPSDLQPTYAPLDPPEVDEDGDIIIKDEEPIPLLGCKHYKRNVKLQCSTCDRWYTCRMCHNEAENHTLIRKETKNMLCMICRCAQRAGEFCVGCGERTAWYYCDVCKLWDNDSNKPIYHCSDCGICRKGRGLGKDFFHCKTCGTCMSMSVEKSHKCIERVSDCDCPICGEYMFTSPSPVVFMLCGHGIHKACYDEHMKSSYKCPICSKSTVNMESQFRNLDRAIDSQPMPPQFRDTKAMVACNDCYAKSAVAYHWLGLKCAICDSYNTAQLSIISDPAVEVRSVEAPETNYTASPPEQIGESSSLALGRSGPGLGPGPVRARRHSTHMHIPSVSSGVSGRFSPYVLPQRLGRSVSPIRGLGLFDGAPLVVETDESVAEDDLDFWGRDEPRSVTSVENVDEMEEGEDESDDDSAVDDCEDDADEDDPFELLGHR